MEKKATQPQKRITSDQLIKTSEVLKILSCSRDFLVKLRIQGKLIPIIRSKTNHVYSLRDLERYIQEEKEQSRQKSPGYYKNHYSQEDLENLRLIGFFPNES